MSDTVTKEKTEKQIIIDYLTFCIQANGSATDSHLAAQLLKSEIEYVYDGADYRFAQAPAVQEKDDAPMEESEKNELLRRLNIEYKYEPHIVDGKLTIHPVHKKWVSAAWEIEKVYGLLHNEIISLGKARELTTAIIEKYSKAASQLHSPMDEKGWISAGNISEINKDNSAPKEK